MNISRLVSGLSIPLIALAAVSAHADTAKPCAAIAGLYNGTCTNHWGDGDYKFSANLRVWQLPGTGCGGVEVTMWTVDTKGGVDPGALVARFEPVRGSPIDSRQGR